MKDSRRDFLKKTGMLTAGLTIGHSALIPDSHIQGIKEKKTGSKEYIKDTGMKFCFAYFGGAEAEKRKVEFGKQLDVPGAVGGIDPGSVGLKNINAWELEAVTAVKKSWDRLGLKLEVIEGPPSLGEKTKLGLDGRDEEISNFITLMKNLTKVGIDCICYNWMPVINWARTTNDRPGRGGALVTAFDAEDLKDKTLTKYGVITKDTLWKNLEYFLKAVMPEAEKCGMKLAMHPDDPQVDEIRGISRIMNTAEAFRKMYKIYPSINNGITMCQGNFSLMGEDIPMLAREFGQLGIIHFIHFRNVRGGKYNFVETFHDEGQIDMYEAMKAYIEIGFRGPIRPDHVPTMAGDSNERPGYSAIGGLFAVGYIRGLMESIYKTV